MGNCLHDRQPQSKQKQNNPNKNQLKKMPQQQQQQRRLKSNFTCPNCFKHFEKNMLIKFLDQHMKMCVIESDEAPKMSSLPSRELKSLDFYYEKVADDDQGVHYSWSKVIKKNKPHKFSNKTFKKEQILTWTFAQKNQWFRFELQKLRIPWQSGSHKLKIQKNNILYSSLDQIHKTQPNMHKQLKIEIIGEKAQDAGGLLRQWIHLLTKQIFNPQFNLFVRAHTQELTYRINSDSQIDEEFASQILGCFGTVLGKALFQKVPVCSYLDRTLLRQLSNQQTQLSDIFSYDTQLYNSWKYILEEQIDPDDIEIYFSVPQLSSQKKKKKNRTKTQQQKQQTQKQQKQRESKRDEVNLIENGCEILVTQSNKKEYVQKCIDYYCHRKVQKMIGYIKQQFYKIIPENLIAVFHPHQLEMLLYGVPFINLDDWKQNTNYFGAYYPEHKTIIWFWQFLEELPQQKLSKFLQFCTGSERTPINGFGRLETNRGNVSKFAIESRIFEKKDPYPKGHTCFNRFQMPVYPKKQMVNYYMAQILEFNTEGLYGLD